MNPKTATLNDIKFKIEHLGKGLLNIIATVAEHGGIADDKTTLAWSVKIAPSIDKLEKAMGWTRPYSSKIDNISESALLKDGSILMCWTVSTWGGTFASHDSIEVGYYLLRKV